MFESIVEASKYLWFFVTWSTDVFVFSHLVRARMYFAELSEDFGSRKKLKIACKEIKKFMVNL